MLAQSPNRPLRLRALLDDFDAVLRAEYDALRARDPERLEEAINAKQRLASELDAAAPLVAAARKQAETGEDHTEWLAVRDLLSRCALANRTNGAAIDASRAFVTSLLDVMTGRCARTRTYSARGQYVSALPAQRYERV